MNNGKHIDGYKYRNRRRNKPGNRKSIASILLTALGGVVVRDLKRENSWIKSLYYKVLPDKKIEQNKVNQKAIDTEYEILDNEKEQLE